VTIDDLGTTSQPRSDLRTTERRVLADHRGRGGSVVEVPPWDATTQYASLDLPTLALAGAALRDESSRLHLGDRVVAWREGGLVWLRTDVPSVPIVLEQRDSPGGLDRLPPAADPATGRLVWAFTDERAGVITARGFVAPDHEDDAVALPGAALLTDRLRRPLVVRMGTGSVVTTRPAPRRRVEVGARVAPVAGTPAVPSRWRG
jgi:hypothetical protein